MSLLTYEEWQELGCHVIRGEKSRIRDKNGKALFDEDQVEENEYEDWSLYSEVF
ncbi:MAG: hypothetical protein PHQ35_11485 [Phycisphaerae bacterium]|nr:hypothetical protein [Phycisphaerae bacterium]